MVVNEMVTPVEHSLLIMRAAKSSTFPNSLPLPPTRSKANEHWNGWLKNNGTFASDTFKTECSKYNQRLTFSGVGAHHQNGVLERNIKTISQWAHLNMLHAAFHWPEHANIKLWPQAVDYAVWVFN
jgi:hypothetical protein